MSKLMANDQKAKEIAAIEAALAEARADIAAGRVVKGSAEAHVKRVKSCALVGMGEEKSDLLSNVPEGD